MPRAVRRLDRNASPDPEGAAAPQRRILDHADRGRQPLFQVLVGLLVMQDQTPCRAVPRFADEELTPSCGVVRFGSPPDLAAGAAETGQRTKTFTVTEGHGW